MTSDINKIFIVILNYGTYQDSITLVNDLLLQKHIDIQITIVDNQSPNKSFQELTSKFENQENIDIIQSDKNGGYSSGNNIGLKHIAKYNPKYVAVLNNDIRITDLTLFSSLLIELKKYNNSYFVAPTMILSGKERFTAWKVPSISSDLRRAVLTIKKIFGSPDTYHFPKEKKTEFVECLPGSFLFGYYDKFEKLGFFDEELFLFGEENILGYKVKKNGGVNLLCRQYHFDHAWSATIDKSISRIQRIKLQNHGRILFHEKYLQTTGTPLLLLKFLLRIRLIEEYLLVLFRNPRAFFQS
jgi:GT2 family glycosyltransferase